MTVNDIQDSPVDLAANQSINGAVDAVRADQQANPSTAPVVQVTAFPVDQYSQVKEKQEREKEATTSTYLGAMWRQDNWLPAAIDHFVGNAMQPDKAYNPYEEDIWKGITDGVWPEYHGYLAATSSAGQASAMKQDILRKQSDLKHLGDLGTAGNVGRFAAGFVFGIADPINLAAMAVTGGASVAARAAGQVSRMRPIAAGIGSAAVLGAGTERLRQGLSFEDDTGGVLLAGVTSMAFAAPFVGLQVHMQSRMRKAAGLEKQAADALAKIDSGAELTSGDRATLAKYTEAVDKAADVDTGRAAPDVYVNAIGPNKWEPARPTFPAEQRKAYKDAFDLHDAEQAKLREAQLRDIQTDTHLAKATEDQRIFNVLARVNGPEAPPTAMQQAFAKALGKRPEEVAPAAPKGSNRPAEVGDGIDSPMARPAPDAPTSLAHERVWWDEGDGISEGRVIDENPRTGELTVENPETGETTVVNRQDLHDLSPGYKATEPAEGFLGGSIGAAQTSYAPGVWEQSTHMVKLKGVPIRWDFFAHLNQSDNPHLQKLGFKLVKDAIGVDGEYAQGWSASELKKQYQRELAGGFHMEARRNFDEAVKFRKLQLHQAIGFHRDYYEMVSRVARGDGDVLKANADIAPQLQKSAKSMSDFYMDMRRRLSEAQVEGADNLPDNPQYVNRQWRQDNIRTAYAAYGEDLYQAVANAIQVPGLNGNIPKAKSFVGAVMKLEFSHAMQDIHLYSRDMVTLRAELDGAGLSKGEVDSIVDLMFENRPSKAADAGQAGNLKYRFSLDENHSQTMKDGTTFKLADLFENDSRVLIDRYTNSMGGHLAMAKVGYKSRAEFMKEIQAAETFHSENASMTTSADKFNRNKQFAQDLYDNITGRPMSTQSFNRMDRFLSASRALTRSTMLGQLGLMAAMEMRNALALSSFRAMRLQMPTLFGIFRSFKAGHVPTQSLKRDIEMITGFGREHVASYSRQHEITDFTYDRGLTRYDNLTGTAAHAVDYLSGNSHVTSASRNLAARMMTQKHVDFASGLKEMSAKQRERMVHQGISLDDQADLHSVLKKYSSVDDNNGAVQAIDYEAWSREQPESYSKFQLLLQREVRDAIQDQDIGETMPFQHTTVGRIFSELKTFLLVSHTKQFLKSAHYRDSTSLIQWGVSWLGAMMEYFLQQSINLAHDPEKLSERLTPMAVAWGAVPRMPVLGLLPSLMETMYSIPSGGQTLFSNGTGNTDNRNLFITPSMIQAMRLMTLGQVGASSLNPMSTNTVTAKEMRDAMYAIPGGNIFGMRNINDIISSNFPTFKPRYHNE